MRRLLTTILLLILIDNLYGQEKLQQIKGVVVASNGVPILGCNVVLKGTKTGTTTGKCGEFELIIPENYKGKLVFSFLAPREWEVEVDKIEAVPDVVLSLVNTKGHTNQLCERNYKSEKKIKIK